MAENLLPTISSSASITRIARELTAVQTPALIWHSHSGERIELSGRVLMNWVDKSANLLVNECEVEEGTTAHLNTPIHWRSVALALAILRAGACFNSQNPQVGAAFTAHESEVFDSTAEFLLLIDRAPLAMQYTGDLHAIEQVYSGEILDYCHLIRSEGDQFMGLPPQPNTPVSQGVPATDFIAEVLHRAQQIAAANYRLKNGQQALALQLGASHSFSSTRNTLALVREVLATLLAGYAVVILDPSTALDVAEVERILSAERAVTPQL